MKIANMELHLTTKNKLYTDENIKEQKEGREEAESSTVLCENLQNSCRLPRLASHEAIQA
jgi:hypothetical protein